MDERHGRDVVDDPDRWRFELLVRTSTGQVLASLIGILIGQNYDGSARPLAYALLIASLLSLALVLYSEKGRLFRRLHGRQPGHTVSVH